MCIQMSNFQLHHGFHIHNFYIPLRISSTHRILHICLYPSQSHVTTISILIFPYKFLSLQQIPINTCNFVRKKITTFLHHRSFLIVFFIEINIHVLLINYKEISGEHVNIYINLFKVTSHDSHLIVFFSFFAT